MGWFWRDIFLAMLVRRVVFGYPNKIKIRLRPPQQKDGLTLPTRSR
jgi:hypothetical protein